MKMVTIKELTEMVMTLNAGGTIIFYNQSEDEGDNAYGVTKLNALDAHMVILNYLGGGHPKIIDLTRAINMDDSEQEALEDAIADYVHYTAMSKPLRNCVYLKDNNDLLTDAKRYDIKCVCGNSEFYAHQVRYYDVKVGGNNDVRQDVGYGESDRPNGPYVCTMCGINYEDLDELSDPPENNGNDS